MNTKVGDREDARSRLLGYFSLTPVVSSSVKDFAEDACFPTSGFGGSFLLV